MSSNHDIHFDKSKLSHIDLSKYDKKIVSHDIHKHEKIELGKLLGGAEKSSYDPYIKSIFNEFVDVFTNYYSNQRAEKYIEIKQKLSISNEEKDFWIRSTFDIEIAPNKESLKLFVDKQSLLTFCVTESQKDVIIFQNKRFPIFKAAVNELKQNYEKLDSLKTYEEKQTLKATIKCQHENLNKLSLILKELSKTDSEALTQLTSNEKLNKLLKPFFEGTQQIKDEGSIKKELLHNIETLKKEYSKNTHTLKNPITETSIKQGADLFEAVGKSKRWLREQQFLRVKGGSANIVSSLKSKDSTTPVAYYKEGSGGEKASAMMEKLMYDCATIMGDEGSFAPTKETELRTKRDIEYSGDSTDIELNEMGELVKSKNIRQARQGGIQLALEGNSLDEKLTKKDLSMSQAQVIDGFLKTITYGMYDAHQKNIIIDKDGNCKFFDNTRSMPNSNGFIDWCGSIIPSYRSGLLILKESYEKLTDNELDTIKKNVAESKVKFQQLKNFLNNPLKKAYLKRLPPGWLNVEDSLKAMEERIDGMQKALKDNKVECLRDLAFAANPDLKFTAIMQLLSNKIPKGIASDDKDGLIKLQCAHMPLIGSKSIQTLITECLQNKIDLKKIKSWCNDPNLSFDEILSKATFYAAEGGETVQQAKELKKSAKEIFSDIEGRAKIDLKDKNRKEAISYINKKFVKSCEDNLITVVEQSELKKELTQLKNDSYFLLTPKEDTTDPFKIYWQTKEGEVKTQDIDVLSSPGKAIINDKLLAIDKLDDFVDGLINT